MLLLDNIQQKIWISTSYFTDSLSIPQVESCCDLCILSDGRLFSVQILSVAKEASSKSFLICRCFQSKNPSLLSSALTSYVCPILEYLSPIWSPHSVKDIDIIENVQRRFTKLFPHLRSLPYSTRLTLGRPGGGGGYHPPCRFSPVTFLMIPIAKIALSYLSLGMGDTFWHIWHHLDAVTWHMSWRQMYMTVVKIHCFYHCLLIEISFDVDEIK